jgi:trehalose 6-phosphate synthase/phosphatase
MQPGLIIVSNRLPVSVKKTDGQLEFFPSVGGLATGLASYANDPHNKWIGWPGNNRSLRNYKKVTAIRFS